MSNKQTPVVKISQEDVINHIIGMTEEQAIRTLKLNGVIKIRIRERNGQSFVGLQNLETGRINLYITNDKVVKATRG